MSPILPDDGLLLCLEKALCDYTEAEPTTDMHVLMAAMALVGECINIASRRANWTKEKQEKIRAWALDCIQRLPFPQEATAE